MDCPLNYERLPLTTPLSDMAFTVYDTEATGFQVAKDDRMIELGAVVVKGLEVCEERQFQTYVNPHRQISREITELTSISREMVENAPNALEAISNFFEFVEKSNSASFVGHHVAFDMLVLKHELKREKLSYRKYMSIDTLDLIRIVSPEQEGKDLEAYAQSFRTKIYPRHSALGDALTTAHLFVELLCRLEDRGIKTFGELLRLIRK